MEEAAAQASEALEQAQRVQVGGLALFGHPNQIYNGIYLWVNGRVHEGWPWYKHERSIARLYRCTSDAKRQWNLKHQAPAGGDKERRLYSLVWRPSACWEA